MGLCGRRSMRAVWGAGERTCPLKKDPSSSRTAAATPCHWWEWPSAAAVGNSSSKSWASIMRGGVFAAVAVPPQLL